MLSLKRFLAARIAIFSLPLSLLALSFLFLCFAGCSNSNPVVSMAPSEAPVIVLRAADEVVPGGDITGVDMEEEGGRNIYEVQKLVNGVRYEIEVTADGQVLEIEKGDDAEDDD